MITEFEYRVLKLIKNDRLPLGDRLIKYVGSARRLERKGLVGKGVVWYLTDAGEKALLARDAHQAGGAETGREPMKGVSFLDCPTCGTAMILGASGLLTCPHCRPQKIGENARL